MSEIVEQKINIPELRFPEFDGEWIEQRIGDNLELFQRRVSVNTLIPIYTSSRTGLRPQKDHFDGQEIKNEGEYGVVPRGYFTYRHMSDDLTFKFNINDIHDDIAVSKEYPVFKTKKLCSKFLHLKLNHSLSFRKFAAMQKVGGTRTRLYFKTLEEWKTLLPSLPEQQKIASFLSAVDEKIAQLQEKKSLLEDYKKGCMQKLFSQTLRFKDDGGNDYPDWEEKRLGDVAEVYQPETISQNQLEDDGQYLVYGANGVIGNLNRYNHEQEQIAVTCRGNTCGYVTYTQPYSWITGNAMVINTDANPAVSKRFIYYTFKNTDFRYLITGSGQPQITGDIKKHIVKIPHPDEQQKIADFLSAIDDKITHATTQLEQTKTFKKGLLQKMFV